jgi:hypothetical protein
MQTTQTTALVGENVANKGKGAGLVAAQQQQEEKEEGGKISSERYVFFGETSPLSSLGFVLGKDG